MVDDIDVDTFYSVTIICLSKYILCPGIRLLGMIIILRADPLPSV